MLAKKLISILLSFAMVSMLFGCGGRPSNDSGGSSPSTRAVANEAATVPEFATLDDPELLLYMQDGIYADLEAELGEDYVIENVTATYVPFVSDEYGQELAYNSQENVYFGYTLSELD